MMILMMMIIIIVIIVAIMIMMIKIILIIAVVIINSPFQPGNFSTGSTTDWSHFLTKLQVSKPETLLKRDSIKGIFLWILHNFSKNLIYRTPPDDCSRWFLCSNQTFIPWSHFLSFFRHVFPFTTVKKGYKNEGIFTFYNNLYKNYHGCC